VATILREGDEQYFVRVMNNSSSQVVKSCSPEVVNNSSTKKEKYK